MGGGMGSKHGTQGHVLRQAHGLTIRAQQYGARSGRIKGNTEEDILQLRSVAVEAHKRLASQTTHRSPESKSRRAR